MDTGPRHSVSVAAAVVAQGGKVLAIQRRDNGQWEPPGGMLELDEGSIGGLQREVFEETGIHVEPVALNNVYKNLSRGIVSLILLCCVAIGSARETSEAVNLAWLEWGTGPRPHE